MRVSIQDGGRVIYMKDLRPDQMAAVRQYIDSVAADPRASQPKQDKQPVPPTPQEEARMKRNRRPGRVQKHWWQEPDQDDNAVVGQDQDDSVAGEE